MLYRIENPGFDEYRRLIPQLDDHANKFSRGSLLVAGGSKRFTGAPILSALAGARAGSGYVSLAVPECIVEVAQHHLLSIPVIGLPQTDGAFDGSAAESCIDSARHLDAAVIGPGMTATAGTCEFVREMLESLDVPVVLDADALNAISGTCFEADSPACADALSALMERGEARPTILTPHAGELKRLVTGLEADGLGRHVTNPDGSNADFDIVGAAEFVSEETGCIVVAKGPTSYTVYDGRVVINDLPNMAMATAGSGDVLAGIIGSLCAQGADPFDAAALGVFLHSLTGVASIRSVGARSVLATDLVDSIGIALSSLENERNQG